MEVGDWFMFGRRVTLFKLFDFEVRVDASWLIIAALVTWSLAVGVFPAVAPGLTAGTYWWMGVVGAAGLFLSIVIHELFHSLVARRFDLPMHGITLFVFGGVAEMGAEPQSPKVEFLMAIAGPLSSIALGGIFYVLAQAARAGDWGPQAAGVLLYLAWINWILAAFNLIPAFPLDGGRVLRAALWHFQKDIGRATRIASTIGSGFGILLMALGVYRLFFGDFISAVWYFLIGMFLRGASQASYQQVVLQQALAGEPVQRFMHTQPVTVPADISIQRLVDEYLFRYDFKMFPVVKESDHLAGCVTTKDVKQIPKDQWTTHRVEEVVHPCSEENTVSPDTDALKVLSKMRDGGVSRLLVTDRDHLVAVVSLKDLLSFVARKLDLDGGPARLPRYSA
jgi:Zn-dependent protease/CBS domain-containing protein